MFVLQMMREANDKVGPQYQRMTWDALRKSLNGLINKINVKNIKDILPEIFSEVLFLSGLQLLSFKLLPTSPAYTKDLVSSMQSLLL